MNTDPETFIQPQLVVIDAAIRLIAPSDRRKARTRLGIAGLGCIDVAEPPEQVRQMVAQATSRNYPPPPGEPTMSAAFLQKLDQATAHSQSLLCIGLDPDPARTSANHLLRFNQAIIEATQDLAAAYKLNLAFYEAQGRPGRQALADTIDRIRSAPPHALLIGDAKRGDIGPAAAAYAQAMFSTWNFDAVTVNPWGGRAAISPFLDYPERGVFLWLRGSHPGAADLQDLTVESPYGRLSLWEHLARQVQEQDRESQRPGFVVSATAPTEVLHTVRRLSPDRPLLLPGIGVQGGNPAMATRLGTDARGRRALLSASRSIIYAGTGKDCDQAARQAAAALRRTINEALPAAGRERN